jgi:hypothetical protein
MEVRRSRGERLQANFQAGTGRLLFIWKGVVFGCSLIKGTKVHVQLLSSKQYFSLISVTSASEKKKNSQPNRADGAT